MTAADKKEPTKAQIFWREVEKRRRKLEQPVCAAKPTCRALGSYIGMAKVNQNLYQVAFRCLKNHTWMVELDAVTAHAHRGGPDYHDLAPAQGESQIGPWAPLDDERTPVPEVLPVEMSTARLIGSGQPVGAPGEGIKVRAPGCGVCKEPLGAEYYADVKTRVGLLDMCVKCWETWQPRREP